MEDKKKCYLVVDHRECIFEEINNIFDNKEDADSHLELCNAISSDREYRAYGCKYSIWERRLIREIDFDLSKPYEQEKERIMRAVINQISELKTFLERLSKNEEEKNE